MLTPAYLDKLPSRVVQLYAGVEIRILEDMARRIAKMEQLTETAQWQAWRLEQIGAEREFIRYRLQRLTGKTQGELNALFQQAGEEALYFDDKIYRAAGLSPTALAQNKTLQQIIAAGLRKTNQLFENLTSTTANTATRQFESALDDAYMDVVSGAFSYQEAVTRAIKSLSRNGINAIQYPTGHVDHLDVAVRRAVLTGVNQTAAEVQLARMDEMGCDLVETTAHAGARPSHALWQGRVFSRSGRSRRYPDFVSSTGYGSGPGLCGWNCRHSFFPFFEGLSERAYSRQGLAQLKQQNVSYNGKQYTEYDASQLQRAMERQIRRWKREYLALDAAGQDTAQASARLAYWRGRQKDFSRQTGLRQDSFRSRVEGFGRSQASKATAQAKRAVAKAGQSAILKYEEKQAILNYISGGSYLLNAKLRVNEVLTSAEAEQISALDSALRKLPKYKGQVERSLMLDKDSLLAFAYQHTIGSVVSYPAYTSASTDTGYHRSPTVLLRIQSKNGRDLRSYNDAEQEILFCRNSCFKVLEATFDNGTFVLKMEEV